MTYSFIGQHSSFYPVRRLCQALGVSTASYYAWLKRPDSARKRSNKALLTHLRVAFDEHKGRYGSPRLTHLLKARGLSCSENRIARIMKAAGLRARMKKAFKCTTHSAHAQPLATDLVRQDFSAQRPNELWLSDITYIRTREGWLYLSAILDVFSRKIVGFHMRADLQEKLVSGALAMAIDYRNPPVGIVFHSDRGSQYAATAFRRQLKHEGIIQSMGRVGNCYDNAMMESFFSTIKRELLLGMPIFETRQKAYKAIKDYIENYYNRIRIHSGINNMSPVQYEQQAILT